MARAFSDREWSSIIGEFRRSGLTQDDFCRQRQVSIYALRYRLYRTRPRLPVPAGPLPGPKAPHVSNSAPRTAPEFVPVHLRTGPNTMGSRDLSRPSAPLELVVGNQPLVRVPVGFDAATLARLLDLLEERL